MVNLLILDVGHGNSAILINGKQTLVMDAPLGPLLNDTLSSLSISIVDLVLISHADRDHLGGIIGLLLDPDITVKKLFVNVDASKDSEIYNDFRVAVSEARRRFETSIQLGLTTDTTGVLDIEEVHVQVMAPTPELALSGCRGTDMQGNRISSNAMSAVIRLFYDGAPFALFAGDIESIGLRNLVIEHADLKAQLLVFPHHGGLPGNADPSTFAENLCEHVKPDFVVFSIGRGRHSTPRKDIIDGIRKAVPGARIICTELSENCASTVPEDVAAHILDLPARGRSLRCCCGGTLNFMISEGDRTLEPHYEKHLEFIKLNASSALCQK